MFNITNTTGLIKDCLQYFVLGMIQGLTEFFPISSTAHLKTLPVIFGWGDPGLANTAVLQLGSVVAVIAYFRKDLANIFYGLNKALFLGQWQEQDARLGTAIFVGTLPIVFFGMTIKLFWPQFEQSSIRSLSAIATTSIAMGILLGLAETQSNHKKDLKKISGKDGIIIGFGQVLALIPGASRSGITLTTALFTGWRRYDAARFSFLLGIPAITFAGLAQLKEAFSRQLELNTSILPLIVGIISSIFFSWVTIDWLLTYLQHRSAWVFVGYRLFFGISIFIWVVLFGSN